MSYQFSLSEIGLRLIKAYEGYQPDGRYTRKGERIIGYGHKADNDVQTLTQDEAETVLKEDLDHIESLVNNHVHAAMSQSQFDALCSLAHSIGPVAFLKSDVLHALNRGEIITAANEFDTWRLGDVDGKVYMIDALVRRRTAEKALFLRPSVRTVPAPRQDLPARRDDSIPAEKNPPEETSASITDKIERESESSAADASNIVTLYDVAADEEPSSAASKGVIPEDIEMDVADDVVEASTPTSPIAEAAAEVSERLDALMANGENPARATDDWPDSLIETKVDITEPDLEEPAPTAVIDLLDADDAMRESIDTPMGDETVDIDGYDSASRYIQQAKETESQGVWAFVTMIILGLTAAGAGLWANLKGSQAMIGEMGPLITSAAVAIGVLLFLMGLYYLMKHLFGKA